MKNAILAVVILLGLNVSAQNIVPVEQKATYYDSHTYFGKYFKDVNHEFDKFLGNWKYETMTDVVEITIYKKENDSRSNYTEDNIFIRYKYIKNGVQVYDTFVSANYDYLLSLGSFRIPSNTNKCHMLYNEPGQERGADKQSLDIVYVPAANGGVPQLKWDVYYEAILPNAKTPQIPLHMVFEKQP